MQPFDGAKTFANVAFVLLAAATLLTPHLGCWAFVPVLLALYWTLVFCNRLEARNLRDFAQMRFHRK